MLHHLEHTKQMTMAMEKAYIEIENAKREASEKAQLDLAETQGDRPSPLLPVVYLRCVCHPILSDNNPSYLILSNNNPKLRWRRPPRGNEELKKS